MDDSNQEKTSPTSLLESWMKTYADLWGNAADMWSVNPGTQGEASRSRAQESFASAFRTFQSLSQVLAQPQAMESLFKGVHTLPEIFIRVLQPVFKGFMEIQMEAVERAGRIGTSTAAYSFENLDQEALKAWTDVYEREFRQFLRIPQVGLLRTYQERINEATDRFNIFHATIAEFFSILFLPVEKSLKVMQEKLTELADDGRLPEQTREYYRMWVKVLEGHYMNLFKSPQYTQAMSKTLHAMSEFSIARRKILEDAFQSLPIPSLKEMDDLCKEMYLLKKRVRELEKQLSRHSPEPTDGKSEPNPIKADSPKG
ncbi:MAG: poly(R)-hydroxyalkanoic acid synthase subunit PhaE [Thermodesulfobacteriota bacterium]